MRAALLLLALVVGATALAVALVRTVRADGLGHRPPPPSHRSHLADRSHGASR